MAAAAAAAAPAAPAAAAAAAQLLWRSPLRIPGQPRRAARPHRQQGAAGEVADAAERAVKTRGGARPLHRGGRAAAATAAAAGFSSCAETWARVLSEGEGLGEGLSEGLSEGPCEGPHADLSRLQELPPSQAQVRRGAALRPLPQQRAEVRKRGAKEKAISQSQAGF